MGGFQQQQSICFLAVNILLSITAFAGNSLILVALHKESCLHPPSKLLYRCLATTDLLVGLISQPLAVSCWIFSAHEHWIPCRYTSTATFIVSHVLCGVSLLTMTAISVDRLLALLLGLRYRHIVTLKRTYIVVVTFWVLSSVAALCYKLDPRITAWYGLTVVPLCYVISIVSFMKIFCALSHHHAQIRDHVGLVAQPPHALCWRSVVQEQWSLCRYARNAGYITSNLLILVSVMTMTARSVDRLLALLLGLRYKQIVTLKRAYIIVTTFWVFILVASLSAIFYLLIIFLYS